MMEKIDTDYRQQNWKIQAKVFKLFNRDTAPLTNGSLANLQCIWLLIIQEFTENSDIIQLHFALRARQNTAQLVKILGNTIQQNV